MSQFSGYLFRQTLWPTLFFLVVLTGVVWLSQGLKQLDIVINRGQTASTFLELTIYVLPFLLTLVLPISLFCAVLYTLNRLYTDSEIVVMWSSGVGRWSIAAPILLLSLFVMVIGFFLNLYLQPLGYRAMKDKVYEIRADIATGLFREGAFTYPIKGLTVFVREVTTSGELKGIFVQDGHEADSVATYMAESGRLVRTSRGPMLVMMNGTIIRSSQQTGANPIFAHFDQYQYLPDTSSPTQATQRDYTERYLPELLYPNPNVPWDVQNRGRLISEGHMRLATPLYNIALPMIAIVSLLCGGFSRRGFGYRIVLAVIVAIITRIAGVGAHSIVQDNLSLAFIHYLIPVAAICVCAALLSGFEPLRPLRRLLAKTARPVPAAGE